MSGKMYKRKREKGYTQVDNYMINDKSLSWKAKGILLYLMSKPDGWTVIEGDIVKNAKDGRDSVRSGLEELEDKGYMIRINYRDDKGLFQTFSVYDEYPINKEDEDIKELTKAYEDKEINHVGKSDTEKPTRKTRIGKSNSSNKRKSNNLQTNDEQNNDLNNFIEEEEGQAEVNEYSLRLVQEECGFSDRFISHIKDSMIEEGISFITIKEVREQSRRMYEMGKKGKVFYDKAKFLIGGILMNRTSEKVALDEEKIRKYKEEQSKKKRQEESNISIPFYNWLEE